MKLYGSTKNKKQSPAKSDGSSSSSQAAGIKAADRDTNKMIESYQAKKRRRRIIILCAVLAVIVGLFIAAKLIIKPPDVDNNASGPQNPDVNVTSKPGTNDPDNPDTTVSPQSDRINDGVYTFLLVGNDNGYGNTDTMMVGRLDTVGGTLNVVSIPRDTLVNVSWPTKKVNTILSGTGSIDGLISGIKDLLGFSIDCWAVIDLDAFVKLVDTIGGVDYNVPVDMYWDAPDQNPPLHIAIPKGYQHLNGEEALKVVRFRMGYNGGGYPDGDIGRINTQHDFLKTVASQLLTIGNATKVDKFAKIFDEYVETNMSLGNIAWFGLEFLKLKEDNINFEIAPANYNGSINGVSYVYLYLDEWLDMVNTKLNPFKTQIAENNVNILTKDSSGNLYSTIGEVAGGYNFSSAPGYGGGSSSANGGQLSDDNGSGGTNTGEGGGEQGAGDAGGDSAAGSGTTVQGEAELAA